MFVDAAPRRIEMELLCVGTSFRRLDLRIHHVKAYLLQRQIYFITLSKISDAKEKGRTLGRIRPLCLVVAPAFALQALDLPRA